MVKSSVNIFNWYRTEILLSFQPSNHFTYPDDPDTFLNQQKSIADNLFFIHS